VGKEALGRRLGCSMLTLGRRWKADRLHDDEMVFLVRRG
jgi:hypothetical protein